MAAFCSSRCRCSAWGWRKSVRWAPQQLGQPPVTCLGCGSLFLGGHPVLNMPVGPLSHLSGARQPLSQALPVLVLALLSCFPLAVRSGAMCSRSQVSFVQDTQHSRVSSPLCSRPPQGARPRGRACRLGLQRVALGALRQSLSNHC